MRVDESDRFGPDVGTSVAEEGGGCSSSSSMGGRWLACSAKLRPLFGIHHAVGGDVPFYTMEYIDGETLSERIKSRGPMPFDECLSLCRALAAAIDVVHAVGIIHRDIKAGNVMLEKSGRAILTDFGLATVNRSEMRLTGSHVLREKHHRVWTTRSRVGSGRVVEGTEEQASVRGADARSEASLREMPRLRRARADVAVAVTIVAIVGVMALAWLSHADATPALQLRPPTPRSFRFAHEQGVALSTQRRPTMRSSISSTSAWRASSRDTQPRDGWPPSSGRTSRSLGCSSARKEGPQGHRAKPSTRILGALARDAVGDSAGSNEELELAKRHAASSVDVRSELRLRSITAMLSGNVPGLEHELRATTAAGLVGVTNELRALARARPERRRKP